jgi:ribosomal protein S18 acetylase RimI-like enzyme
VESGVVIRKAEPEDVSAIHALIVELAEFEKAVEEVELTVEQLREDAFGKSPIVEMIVAESGGEVVGAALFFEKYSTWKGRSMHLEDFVVKRSRRRRGIGSLLFEEVMRIAAERRYARMDWQVLDWNDSAIAFYRKYGAQLTSEWLDGRLTRDDLKDYR